MRTLYALALSLTLAGCSTAPPSCPPAHESASFENTLLSSSDPSTRYYGIITLKKHHDSSGILPLRQVLADPHEESYIRGMAAYTLGVLDDRESAILLRTIVSDLHQDTCVRDGAVVALGILHDRSAVQTLASVINSPSEPAYLRADASLALSRIQPDYQPLPLAVFRNP